MSNCVGKQEVFRPRMHTDGTRIFKAGKTKGFWSERKLIHRKEEQTKAGLTNDGFKQISLF